MGEEGEDTLGKSLPESFGSGGGQKWRSLLKVPVGRERDEREKGKKGEEEERRSVEPV
jgi:hypothetical protein